MRLAIVLLASVLSYLCHAEGPQWKHLSSKNGDLPAPGTSTEQTGALVADFDKDGTNDFIISFRQVAPALVWYRHRGTGWERQIIEPAFLTVEAGGAVCDIDQDGDLRVSPPDRSPSPPGSRMPVEVCQSPESPQTPGRDAEWRRPF